MSVRAKPDVKHACSTPPLAREIDAFFRKQKRVIVALPVPEILDEEIANKLA